MSTPTMPTPTLTSTYITPGELSPTPTPAGYFFKLYRARDADGKLINSIVTYRGIAKLSYNEFVSHLNTHKEAISKEVRNCIARYRARRIHYNIKCIDPATGFVDVKNGLVRSIPNLKQYAGFPAAVVDELLQLLRQPGYENLVSIGFTYDGASFDHITPMPSAAAAAMVATPLDEVAASIA